MEALKKAWRSLPGGKWFDGKAPKVEIGKAEPERIGATAMQLEDGAAVFIGPKWDPPAGAWRLITVEQGKFAVRGRIEGRFDSKKEETARNCKSWRKSDDVARLAEYLVALGVNPDSDIVPPTRGAPGP